MATLMEKAPQKTQNLPYLTFELTTPIDDARPVFLVGSFNNWTVDDPRFQMKRLAKGRFFLSFPTDKMGTQPFEYKYVRGGWENKELDTFGNSTPNRVLPPTATVVTDVVPRWANYGLAFNPRFLPKIEDIDTAFYSPELGKSRRVRILLPYDYHNRPEKRYPVIYLHDAQNLFDDKSPFGNWAIDRKMAVLAERGQGDVIIVAIDHGGAARINEFLPVANSRLGASQGRKYVRFVAETLKPHIDQAYRTIPSRTHTGMGGSSMGGLISIYAGLMYPQVFGRLMIFSPSLWVAPNIAFDTIAFFKPLPVKIYVYAGGREGSNMLPNAIKLQKSIENQGFDPKVVEVKLVIDPEGDHTEKRWGEEFPKAIEWLFG